MRLGKRARKGLLVTHIVTSGVWLGMDVVMGLLVIGALAAPAMAVTYFQGLAQFAVWPLVTMGVLCAASGVLLGLGTRYGLVRYWWVAVKLALNVILVVLVVFELRPGVLDAAAGRYDISMIMPPIVSTSALLFATIISVVKPWGRIRRRTYPGSRSVTDDRTPVTTGS
ncbi:hypothetical protein GCM10029964_036110 [Kibdelosporangium lantanae]